MSPAGGGSISIMRFFRMGVDNDGIFVIPRLAGENIEINCLLNRNQSKSKSLNVLVTLKSEFDYNF